MSDDIWHNCWAGIMQLRLGAWQTQVLSELGVLAFDDSIETQLDSRVFETVQTRILDTLGLVNHG